MAAYWKFEMSAPKRHHHDYVAIIEPMAGEVTTLHFDWYMVRHKDGSYTVKWFKTGNRKQGTDCACLPDRALKRNLLQFRSFDLSPKVPFHFGTFSITLDRGDSAITGISLNLDATEIKVPRCLNRLRLV